jgi:tetratricopeptide (TPR) repeat protein
VVELANYLYRALLLLGLAIAPRVFSPDPATPKNVAIALFVPLLFLGGLLGGAYHLKKRFASREASIAAGLVWASVAVAVLVALYYSGPRAPLARGAAPLALVVWPALAAIAATLAGEYLGSSFKHKRTAAAAVVLSGGLFVHGDAHTKMGDVDFMWKTALDREPENEAAFERVTRPLLVQGKLDEVTRRAGACLRVSPTACPCLIAKVAVAQKKREAEKAVQVGADAVRLCPNITAARAANAEALALAGKLDEALAEADEAIALADDPPRAHAAKASVLLSAGRLKEAEQEAQKASDAGDSHEAKLVTVRLAIDAGDIDGAEAMLKSMKAADPPDPHVLYNLALIADKRNKYNDARNGYLATLKLDPTYKQARYNLALLTHRRGVLEEAKNHAKKFADMAPNDPLTAPLMQTIFGEKPQQPPLSP